jgi:hypothetical protein
VSAICCGTARTKYNCSAPAGIAEEAQAASMVQSSTAGAMDVLQPGQQQQQRVSWSIISALADQGYNFIGKVRLANINTKILEKRAGLTAEDDDSEVSEMSSNSKDADSKQRRRVISVTYPEGYAYMQMRVPPDQVMLS